MNFDILSPLQACDLLTKLFTNHLVGEAAAGDTELSHWQDTWVLPALDILCDPHTPQHHKGFMVEVSQNISCIHTF